MNPPFPSVQIERLHAGQGERLRALRLRALQDAPDAFATTWQEAAARPLETWDRQIEQFANFVATLDGHDVGLVRGARHAELRDTGYLLSMWVAPEARRQGIAGELMAAVAEWAGSEGLRHLLLDVAEGNAAAIALYIGRGFAPNGVCGALPPPREHIREIQLELKL